MSRRVEVSELRKGQRFKVHTGERTKVGRVAFKGPMGVRVQWLRQRKRRTFKDRRGNEKVIRAGTYWSKPQIIASSAIVEIP